MGHCRTWKRRSAIISRFCFWSWPKTRDNDAFNFSILQIRTRWRSIVLSHTSNLNINSRAFQDGSACPKAFDSLLFTFVSRNSFPKSKRVTIFSIVEVLPNATSTQRTISAEDISILKIKPIVMNYSNFLGCYGPPKTRLLKARVTIIE